MKPVAIAIVLPMRRSPDVGAQEIQYASRLPLAREKPEYRVPREHARKSSFRRREGYDQVAAHQANAPYRQSPLRLRAATQPIEPPLGPCCRIWQRSLARGGPAA